MSGEGEHMHRALLFLLFLVFMTSVSAWASFTDNGDGTITDTATGLVWQKGGGNQIYTWAGALAYCGGLSLAGQTDWRLPDKRELESLVDYTQTQPAINGAFSGNCQLGWYWSSTTQADSPAFGWEVTFSNGYSFRSGKSKTNYARCVRGGPAGSAAPTVTLTATGSGITVGGSNVIQYRYKVDSGQFGALTPVSTPIPIAGKHSVTVYGYNSAGKISDNAATMSWPTGQTVVVPALDRWGAGLLELVLMAVGVGRARRGEVLLSVATTPRTAAWPPPP